MSAVNFTNPVKQLKLLVQFSFYILCALFRLFICSSRRFWSLISVGRYNLFFSLLIFFLCQLIVTHWTDKVCEREWAHLHKICDNWQKFSFRHLFAHEFMANSTNRILCFLSVLSFLHEKKKINYFMGSTQKPEYRILFTLKFFFDTFFVLRFFRIYFRGSWKSVCFLPCQNTLFPICLAFVYIFHQIFITQTNVHEMSNWTSSLNLFFFCCFYSNSKST